MLTALSKAEGPFDKLTALSKAERLHYTSSFVIATYCKYASFLKIRKPCIWNFLLCRYEIINITFITEIPIFQGNSKLGVS